MKYLLCLAALFLPSVALATHGHQNVQRVVVERVVDDCHQAVRQNVVVRRQVVVEPVYEYVLPVEVAYPHRQFVQEEVVYDNVEVQKVVVEKQRQGRLRQVLQNLGNRRNVKSQVVVEKQVVRQRNLGSSY